MTRRNPVSVVLMRLGGDQRERDREKARKKAEQQSKKKGSSAKDREAYGSPYPCSNVRRDAEISRQKQKLADERLEAQESKQKGKK